MQLDLGGERGKAESAFVTQRPSLGGFWNVLRTREKAVEGQRVAASRHGLTVAGSGPLDCPSAMKRSEAPSPVTPGRALETEPKHEVEEASHQTTRAVGRHSWEMSPRGEPGETERVRLRRGLAGGAREGGPPGAGVPFHGGEVSWGRVEEVAARPVAALGATAVHLKRSAPPYVTSTSNNNRVLRGTYVDEGPERRWRW